MTALDALAAVEAHVHQDVSAEALDDRRALDGRRANAARRVARWRQGRAHRSRRQRIECRLEPGDTALELADPHPHAGIDVALVTHDDFDRPRVVRRGRGRRAWID